MLPEVWNVDRPKAGTAAPRTNAVPAVSPVVDWT
jgi:hypothetical protein